MFFKKKSSTPPDQAPNFVLLFVELATELYRGMGAEDSSASLTATLDFDSQQRVSTIHDPKVDGMPKIPTPETVENLNKLAAPLKSFPKIYQLKSLEISIVDGRVNANPVYAED